MELKLKTPLALNELAKYIEANNADQLPGMVSSQLISALSTIENSSIGCVSFVSNPLYIKYLATTNASAVIVSPQDAEQCNPAVVPLITSNPRLAIAKLLQLCDDQPACSLSIHPSAVIGKNVKLGKNLSIAANCVIGDDCEIGDNTVLEAGVVIGCKSKIGNNCVFKANVTIYHSVIIGNNCAFHSGCVIGSDGFGYAVDKSGNWIKMLHLGAVSIGNNVEIGSNTTIDRGMLENTEIGNNVIIDNLVQIGHNVVIGDGTAIAGCAGIAGSTVVGKRCLIGGAVSIAGHITICDNVHITGTSAVSNSINSAGVYSSGFPAKENSAWRRNVARFMSLDSLAKRVKELEKSLVNL